MQDATARAQGFVSVIIPVRDDEDRLRRCLQALRDQDFPRDRFEVIVVDNGSTDGSLAVAREWADRVEQEAAPGSYAARNRGIQVARGDVFAFTDADCTPRRDWLTEGVRALQDADLAGGHVQFVLSRRPTGAERMDSVRNMLIRENVKQGAAKTANLFVRRAVFDAIGTFRGDLRSGGDVEWTKRATGSGHRLVYAPRAIVEHPARRLLALMRKQVRVGVGQAALQQGTGASRSQVARGALNRLLPPKPGVIRHEVRQFGEPGMDRGFARLWGAAWAMNVATAVGRLRGLAQGRTGRP